MFITGSVICPVKTYREYMIRRIKDCRGSESRFYLQPIPKLSQVGSFKKNQKAKNSIGKIANKMSSQRWTTS